MVGQSSRPIFQPLVFTEPQPIVHTASRQPAAQAAFGNPLFEYHAASPRSVSQGYFGEFEEFKEQYQTLEKRLGAMEGNEFFSGDANNMCLVSDLVMPAKFKTPEFEKYRGHTCPRIHLVMYF